MNLRSSQSSTAQPSCDSTSYASPITGRTTLKHSILMATPAEQRVLIARKSREAYGQDAKELQIEAVMSLTAQKKTFALVGTGFGKSRIAELYYRMFGQKEQATVLTLNPLDALGDNQVRVLLICLNTNYTNACFSDSRSKRRKKWAWKRLIWPSSHSQVR